VREALASRDAVRGELAAALDALQRRTTELEAAAVALAEEQARGARARGELAAAAAAVGASEEARSKDTAELALALR